MKVGLARAVGSDHVDIGTVSGIVIAAASVGVDDNENPIFCGSLVVGAQINTALVSLVVHAVRRRHGFPRA